MTKDYPMNCYSRFRNNAFSGWYPVSDKFQCHDFCFWKAIENANTTTSIPPINPHETTTFVQDNTTYVWGCLLNVGKDDTTFSEAMSKPFVLSDATEFDPLRCAFGAERINTRTGQTLQTASFWIYVTTLFSLIIALQIGYLVYKIRSNKNSDNSVYNTICTEEEEHNNNNDEEDEREEGGQTQISQNTDSQYNNFCIDDEEEEEHNNNNNNVADEGEEEMEEELQTTAITPTPPCTNRTLTTTIMSRWLCCRYPQTTTTTRKRLSLCRYGLCIIIGNGVLLFMLFMGILSLMEIVGEKDLQPFVLKTLTPSCSVPRCKHGTVDIINPSKTFKSTSSARQSITKVKPFAYIIASDTQLNWYNGESRHIGTKQYPPPCTAKDSCGSCKHKFGSYTNDQMKRTMEYLIANSTFGTLPKTLVMNGDLTAYYHRSERDLYEEYYHNVQGLEEYFPALGNHDYHHSGGATYDNDQWITPHTCNALHSIGYIQSAFCNKVHNFVPHQRITRYDSKSLAYSWDQYPYHFVQLHYYPTYENAKLGIHNSVQWLENDLQLAQVSNLTTILFVHSADNLNNMLEPMLIQNKVAAIFTGHLHRCFGRKCAGLSSLSEYEVEELLNTTTNIETVWKEKNIEKCYPAKAALCGGSVTWGSDWMNMVSLKDMDHSLPNTTLKHRVIPKEDLCASPDLVYINTTDNTLLCQEEVLVEGSFGKTKIPIFWSGSSSFETLILTDFYHDRFVVNFITAAEGKEGMRYVDVFDVPNAVYHLHNVSDLSEVTIWI